MRHSLSISFSQDSKSSSTLTGDARNSVGTLTQDSRGTGVFLWQLLLPWSQTQPWMITGNASILDLDN